MNASGMNGNVPGSFRDPCGFLFYRSGVLYRQINERYQKNYDHLTASGLYQALTGAGLLVPHEEAAPGEVPPQGAYKIIRPEPIPFISYPYEWCFSQLKDAALLTLEIQKTAFRFGMSLKDSSGYNIQFRKGKPVLIDTLSFEIYEEGKPWTAYRQFCQHFLAPLALMSYRDIRMNQWLRVHLDGIPLDLAGRLLPWRTRFVFPLLMHIHLHAKSQKHFAGKGIRAPKHGVTRLAFMGLADSLETAVRGLRFRARGTEWGDYYDQTNYSAEGFEFKKQAVAGFLDRVKPGTVWDLGANTGVFSRIASGRGIPAISFDADPAAVEKNYARCTAEKDENLLPLLMDLTNPSPGTGWQNTERMPLAERGPADMALALALIHHLAISHNLPFEKIAGFFAQICRSLIIEFVPKEDSQTQRLLASREDIFPGYTREAFERAFEQSFTVLDSVPVKDSQRVLYLMHSKKAPA